MVVFNTLSSSRNPMEACYWLVGANVNGRNIPCDGRVKDFILKLEAMNANVSKNDLWWMNNLCRKIFGRDYQTAGEAEMVERAEKAKENSYLLNNVDRTKSRR